MAEAARLGLLVAVHAENDALTAALDAARRRATSWPRGRWSPSSRRSAARSRSPPRRAARCTSCTCRAGAGVALVTEARPRGVDVTCETCPHYLLLTPERRRGARRGRQVRAAGPRRRASRSALWEQVRGGAVHFVTSDHSPSSSRRSRRRVRRRVGRDRGLPVDAGAAARASWRPRLRRATDVDRRGRAFGMRARAASSPARTPTSRSSTSPRSTRCAPRTCSTATRSPPTSAGGCAGASCARCCAAADPAPGAGRLLTPERENPRP